MRREAFLNLSRGGAFKVPSPKKTASHPIHKPMPIPPSILCFSYINQFLLNQTTSHSVVFNQSKRTMQSETPPNESTNDSSLQAFVNS